MPAAGSRRAFATLDAIRGVAAICVMGFHYALLDHTIPLRFENAFIDVDLFFCLSGFVLMQAYGDWAKSSRGISEFMKLRLIRLYPMYLAGTAIGVVAFIASLTPESSTDIGRLTLSLMSALLMLPDLSGTISIPLSITPVIYPFDVPAWSLFFEMLANVALCARRWDRVSLLLLAVMAGIALVAVSLAMRTINGGFDAATMIVGLLRVSYNFTVGALLMKLYQGGSLARFSLPPCISISLVILISAFLPVSGRVDVALVLFAIPLTIVIATRDPQTRWGLSISAWLGRISYPLYAIHYPLVLLAMQFKGPLLGGKWMIGLCAVFSIGLSDLLARTLDPVARRKLSQAFIGRAAPALNRSPDWGEGISLSDHSN